MKLFRNMIIGAGLLLVTSCGGKTLCDAYGYIDYSNKEEKTPIVEQELDASYTETI